MHIHYNVERRLLLTFVFTWLTLLVTASPLLAQNTDRDSTDIQEKAIKVYLDDMWGISDYIKKEITYVNYVRDRKDAQVHIIMADQRTGGGGREYSFFLIGQKNFTGVNDTLKYISMEQDAEEVVRAGIVRTLQIGLLRYVSKTPLIENISVHYQQKTDPEKVKDKWNYWLFRIGTSCHLSGEESSKRYSFDNNISANRVTPDWKIQLGLWYDYSESNFNYEDWSYKDISRRYGLYSMLVKSLGEHWSIGGMLDGGASTYSNQDLYLYCTPALEFNIFPYSESTRRQFSFLYRVGAFYNDYREETLYDKMNETLSMERLTVSFMIKEKWGSMYMSVYGSHFFHDFSKNRLNIHVSLDLKLFKGISVNFWGGGSRIHDQLGLPKRGATEEEVLLHRREIATQYSFHAGFGLNYTFGSIYSNVVNPRFGSRH